MTRLAVGALPLPTSVRSTGRLTYTDTGDRPDAELVLTSERLGPGLPTWERAGEVLSRVRFGGGSRPGTDREEVSCRRKRPSSG